MYRRSPLHRGGYELGSELGEGPDGGRHEGEGESENDPAILDSGVEEGVVEFLEEKADGAAFFVDDFLWDEEHGGEDCPADKRATIARAGGQGS